MKRSLFTFFPSVFLTLFLTIAVAATPVSDRSNCFPFERLPEEERSRAEALLLKALDSEALYTIVGGIKPMSSGFSSYSTSVRLPRNDEAKLEREATLSRLEADRRSLALWRCGDNELFADIQNFFRIFDGKRHSEAVVFNRRSLKNMLGAKGSFFDRWGITPSSHPLQVLNAVETAEMTPRFAGYGYLFGYPDHAVRFFVEAANSEELTGEFVERDFYSIPTVVSNTNRFVFAVPIGHKETPADRDLKERAERVLEDYKNRRSRYVGENGKGVVELLRDWFCSPGGDCSVPRF
jgi:hypothetical protein